MMDVSKLLPNERIKSPGKFEGCLRWVPYLWSLVLEGEGDESYLQEGDGPEITCIKVFPSEAVMFPELAVGQEVYLWEDDQGFVHASLTRPGSES